MLTTTSTLCCVLTVYVELDVVGVVVVLGADLTLVNTFIHRSDVLYDQTPFVRPLVVVDTDACVRSERVQADRERVDFVHPFPGYLFARDNQSN